MAVEDAWDYHVATGNPLGRAKDLLSAMSLVLRARVMLAIQQQGKGSLLADPIESDPLVAEKIRSASAEAKQAAELAGHMGRGSCHVIWAKQAEILTERHGIVWFSPKEASKDQGAWGALGPFTRSPFGPPHDEELTWLELSVYDVTGLLDPIPNMGVEDEKAMAAMTEDNHIDQFIARQH